MKKLAALMIKILALYSAVKAIGSLSAIVQSIPIMNSKNGMGTGNTFVLYFSPFIINLILSILLWGFSSKLANTIVTENSEFQVLNKTIDYNQLLTIAIKVVGVILVVMSLEEGLWGLVSLVNTPMDMMDFSQRFVLLFKKFYPFFQMIIGIVLVTNKGLHKMIGFKE